MSNEIEKKVMDVSKISFSSSGKYELEEIVDHDFLQVVGGGFKLGDIEVNLGCGDETTNKECATNWIACETNKECDSEDGDDE